MRLRDIINKFKKKKEIDIVAKGNFSVWHGVYCSEGHCWLPKDSTEGDLGYALVMTIIRTGYDNNVPFDDIINQLNENLKNNGFKNKIE